MKSKLPVLILIVLGLFAAALIMQRGEVLWLAFPLVMYIAIGVIACPVLENISLLAKRQLHQFSSDGRRLIEVEVTIHNQGCSLPNVEVIDRQPDGVMDLSCQTGIITSITSGGKGALNYSFQEKRGHYTWKSIHLRIGDPLGLIFSELNLGASGELSIHPEQEKLQRLPLHPHNTLHAPGAIPAFRAGSGTDFWGIRQYHPGDSLRWLDWRLNARYPGQLFTREFEQEEVADIGLILDARSETDQLVEGKNLFEYSVRAVVSLAESFIHQGNRVSLLAMGQKIQRVFPGYGKYQLHKILDTLSGIRSSSPGRILGLHYLPLEMFSNRTLLIILSPLTRTDSLFFLRTIAYGYQVMLISPDPYDFVYQAVTKGGEWQQAFFLARQERRIQLQSIASLNVRVIDWQVSQPLLPMIRASLGHLRGQGESRAYYGR